MVVSWAVFMLAYKTMVIDRQIDRDETRVCVRARRRKVTQSRGNSTS